MPAVIPANPKLQFSDILGYSLPGGKLYTYLSGSTTPHQTWQDAAQTTLNANPITLNSAGECTVFLDPTVAYRFVLTDAAGVQRWSQDNIEGVLGTATGIQPNTITTAMLQDGSVTAPKLAASLLSQITSAGQQWKNRFINGEMNVSQKYVDASTPLVANTDKVITDLWTVNATVAGTAQRVIINVAGVPYYGLQITLTTAGSVAVYQNIPAKNIRDLQLDTNGDINLSAYFNATSIPKTPTWQIAAPTVEDNFTVLTATQSGSFPSVTASNQRSSASISIANAAYSKGLQCKYLCGSIGAGETFTITGCQVSAGSQVSDYAYGRPYLLELLLCGSSPSAPVKSVQYDTVGSFSFTVQPDVYRVYLTGCGSGGGGGGGNGSGGGGGGGGALCIRVPIDVTPGDIHTVTIPAGGAGGTPSGNGTAGGTTSFGALYSLGGGGLGQSGAVSYGGGAGGTGGTRSITGCNGGTQVGPGAGVGGSSLYGGGNPSGGVGLPGGGGGGGSNVDAGGAGGRGFLLVEWD